jgi:acetylornithine/succinyldiaminopimelate/putrescine aminotransferase
LALKRVNGIYVEDIAGRSFIDCLAVIVEAVPGEGGVIPAGLDG